MSDLSHKDLWEHIELWGWHIASVLLIFIVFPIARWIGNNTLLRVKKIEEEKVHKKDKVDNLKHKKVLRIIPISGVDSD